MRFCGLYGQFRRVQHRSLCPLQGRPRRADSHHARRHDVRAAERLADGRSDGRLAGRIFHAVEPLGRSELRYVQCVRCMERHAVQYDVRGYLRQLLRHREIDQQVGPLLRDGPSGARRRDDARRRLLRPDPLQQGGRRLVLCRVRLGGGGLQAYHRGPRGRGDHALRLCAGVSGVETAG